MRVGDLSPAEFASMLDSGIKVQIGPFAANLGTNVADLSAPLYSLYADYRLLPDDSVYSFHARLDSSRNSIFRSRKLVRFSVDGRVPHEDMPARQALAILEWGINLVIALRFHCFLMLHSAVVEIDGRAMLLPAAPGFGKSTLCAGLALSGWRLLSDEFGLVRPGTVELVPVPRPLALKNESIDVIRRFDAGAEVGPEITGTRKGTVAHLKPPAESVRRGGEPARANWIVFPRWRPDVSSELVEISKARSFMLLASNAFNYELIGETAFRAVDNLIENARSYYFEYSDLGDATRLLTDLARNDGI